MVRPRSLFLLSALCVSSIFGVGASVVQAKNDDSFTKGNSRADAEQDPFESVTLASQDGDPQSTLFASCLASSRTFDAKLASIEVASESEYIRYVPDSFQLRTPVPWDSLTGDYPSIFECASAAHDGQWPMFKYDGAECKVTSNSYSLDDVPTCEEEEAEAVFILSSADIPCPLPRFLIGYDNSDVAVCGLVNEDLMTYAEAKDFCINLYHFQELGLYNNDFAPLTVADVIGNFTALGYTRTNLWVGAEDTRDDWYGGFVGTDWQSGEVSVSISPYNARGYMDKANRFKLVPTSDATFKAGALCTNYALTNAD